MADLDVQSGQIDIYLFDQLLLRLASPRPAEARHAGELASAIGIENRVRQTVGRRYLLPDSTERYLVDEPVLMELTRKLGGALLDPLKTTIVQNQRCMTTWVVRKGA
jgi:hypothetical protein